MASSRRDTNRTRKNLLDRTPFRVTSMRSLYHACGRQSCNSCVTERLRKCYRWPLRQWNIAGVITDYRTRLVHTVGRRVRLFLTLHSSRRPRSKAGATEANVGPKEQAQPGAMGHASAVARPSTHNIRGPLRSDDALLGVFGAITNPSMRITEGSRRPDMADGASRESGPE